MKTVTCCVCGKETSKRQTLLISHNGTEGRACREHPETNAFVAAKVENEATQRKLLEINEQMRAVFLASYIEVHGLIAPHLTEARLFDIERRFGTRTLELTKLELEKRKDTPISVSHSHVAELLAFTR